MRIWSKAIVLLAIVLVAVPAVAKDDELTPEQRFEKKWRKHRDWLAKENFKIGGWLKRKKAFKTAHIHYLLTIHFDPDHRFARQRLGYKHRNGEWLEDDLVEYDDLEDEWRPDVEYREKVDEFRKERVKELQELAEYATKLGLAAKAKELIHKAVLVDPSSEVARAAAGYKKLNLLWFDDEELAQFPKEIPMGRVDTGRSPVAEALDLTTETWTSGRYVVEGTGAPAEFQNYLRAAVMTEAYLKWLVGVPVAPDGTPYNYIALDDADMFGEYLDTMLKDVSPTQRAFIRDLGVHTTRAYVVSSSPLSNDKRDYLAHNLGQRAMWMLGGGREVPWLLAGFTDYVSDRLAGTMICRFCKMQSSGGASIGRNDMTAMMWRRRIQAAVLAGKDTPSEDIFRADIPALNGLPGMKAWSLFDFFADRDRTKFAELIRIAQSGEEKSDDALQAAYGLRPGQLDLQWREWVIENY